MRCRFTRREFIAGSLSLVAEGLLPSNVGCSEKKTRKGRPPRRGAGPSTVVSFADPKVFGKSGHEVKRVEDMVLEAIAKSVGASKPDEAMRSLFKPTDTVALKLNCLAGPSLSSSVSVVNAIIKGLRSIGVPLDHIILFERSTREMTRVGFKSNRYNPTGPLCYGNDEAGWSKDIEFSGEIGSLFSKVVTDQADAIINVPVLKDHDLAGIACGMKNMYGVIHNPNKYHENNCDPYVADVMNHPHIKDKLRLTVCDGLTAQFQGGPAAVLSHQWKPGQVLASTDPVALDAVAADIIEEKRKEKGMRSLVESRREPKWLLTAHKKGLGEHRLEKITLVQR